MDPLSLLRDYVRTGRLEEARVAEDVIDFLGLYSFPKSERTSYKSNKGKGGFYDLATLVFFARSLGPAFKFSDYHTRARDAGIGQINYLDHKDLEAYFTGQIDTSAYIQLEPLPNKEPESKRRRTTSEPSPAAALDVAAAAPEAAGEPSARAQEASALRAILAGELQLRDRNSMLRLPGRSWTRVLAIADEAMLRAAKDAAARAQKAHKAHASLARKRGEGGKGAERPREAIVPPGNTKLPVLPSGRYERATSQDATLRDLAGQMGLSNLALAGGEAGALPFPPPPPPPPLEGNGEVPPPPPPPLPAPLPTKNPSVAKPLPRGSAKPSSAAARGTPIIMVPSGLTSLVTMYNIKDLLERGVFCSSETLRQRGAPKPERMRVRRTVGRATPVEYTITDREPRCKEEWERVVAVFCSGKVWQFKQWPYKGAAQGDMVETFHKVCGFYLHYHDEKVDPMIRKWNVKTLPLHRESRHRDVAVVQELYAALDRHLQARRCKLVY